MENNGLPLINENGELSGYHGIKQMVRERTTQIKKLKDELVQKERLATLGKLTTTVSHELRNPLGTIGSSLSAIRSGNADVLILDLRMPVLNGLETYMEMKKAGICIGHGHLMNT